MALTLIPYPDGMVWQDWADTLVGYNADLTSQVSPDEEWIPFARRLVQFEPKAPPPEAFATWQDWARGLGQALDV